jgi:hypothetical protein
MPKKYLLTISDPEKIDLIYKAVYWLYAIILNLAIRHVAFLLTFIGYVKPNIKISVAFGIVIGEISYRIAPKLSKYKIFSGGDVDLIRSLLLWTLSFIFNISYLLYTKIT